MAGSVFIFALHMAFGNVKSYGFFELSQSDK